VSAPPGRPKPALPDLLPLLELLLRKDLLNLRLDLPLQLRHPPPLLLPKFQSVLYRARHDLADARRPEPPGAAEAPRGERGG